MTGWTRLALVSALALSAGISTAQVSDFSGSWKLNPEKSSWGKRPKLVSVIVTIEHKEPSVKYSGMVVDTTQEMRNFNFSGTVDGKEYPSTTAYGSGKVKLSRLDRRTIQTEITSDDRRSTQSITTTVSRDGKTMTRRLRVRDPNGSTSWTEVYERQ
jgi:hypothetical protein